MQRVEGHKNLYRDEDSGAIVNTDSAGYMQYMKAKTQKENEKAEFDRMKSDIEEIKSLLKDIVGSVSV